MAEAYRAGDTKPKSRGSPKKMRERYLREFEITGVATYGRFRRFAVRTEERIR
jgi:hypothetical protein